jgi:hypothetical protein
MKIQEELKVDLLESSEYDEDHRREAEPPAQRLRSSDQMHRRIIESGVRFIWKSSRGRLEPPRR